MSPVRYHSGQFPPRNLDWQRLLPMIGPARAAVARYEGILQAIPNPDVLLAPLASQEAVLSNRIEGTQTTLTEVLTFEAVGGAANAADSVSADIHEVLNYRLALTNAIETMERIPLSQRLIRNAHQVLLRGVRGFDKAPGDYRRMPDTCWIGPPGCTIEEASYIPCPVEELPSAMHNWEFYLHEKAPDDLVQLAIAHAEFEAIHPFLDGNGRMGRLIVPLFMVTKNLLPRPVFYISEYLERERAEYYERLLAISRDGDWTGWCAFFLRAISGQAAANQARAREILHLYNARRDWIVEETHSQYGVRALDWIFSRPLFKTSDFVKNSEIPNPTASRILRVLRDNGLLRVIDPASGRRPAIVAFPELLNIAEGREVF